MLVGDAPTQRSLAIPLYQCGMPTVRVFWACPGTGVQCAHAVTKQMAALYVRFRTIDSPKEAGAVGAATTSPSFETVEALPPPPSFQRRIHSLLTKLQLLSRCDMKTSASKC